MLTHPNINPVAIDLGMVQIHWYSLMYLAGFLSGYTLLLWLIKTGRTTISRNQAEDAILFTALGLIIGARLGYFIFYHPSTLLTDPLRILKLSTGGMSFHGGFIGVFIAALLFSRQYKVRLGELANIITLAAPIGIFFGRIGNFIGQELWGRETDVAWGMVFQRDALRLVRHPSQLYEAIGEGLVIFLILLWYNRKPRPEWSSGALFVLLYGSIRFCIEFFREPDAHIGFDALGWMTRGQILCLPMAIAGLAIFLWAVYRKDAPLAGVPVMKEKSRKDNKSPKKSKKHR